MIAETMGAEVAFIPVGKIRCYITGELRNDSPEEHVRQRVARSFVEEYGYDPNDIGLEFRINVGRAKKRVDIAIFQHGKAHIQENIFIIAEAKREEIKPNDRDNGIDQLMSYLSACFNAKWGLWIGSELQAYEVITEAGERRPVDVADIPPYGKTQAPRITFDKLTPAEGLRDTFKRCHNYIYANQGIPKDQAFHDLLKLIFCKVYDEQTTAGEMRFDITTEERRSTLGQRRLKQRMDELFREVKEHYPYIFDSRDNIRLDSRVLAYIVSELRRFSLLDTATDVKGEAYQEIVRENLRGARGEFFTPPNVCKMAVEMVFGLYPSERCTSLKVLDPACGTGGFLKAAMNFWRDYIIEIEERKWKGRPDKISDASASRLKDVCNRNLFGVDINPELVRASQMNLVMNGDGSTNVIQDNSLLSIGEWQHNNKTKIQLESFDIVVTNPPFGTGQGLAIDDPHILDQFELTRFEANAPRNSMPPEQIFIERCIQFLRPSGIMAIVLPNSILSNPGLAFIRHWILKRCRVIASVDLPVETFLAFGGTGTQTGVLLLQKKTAEEIRLEEASKQMQDYNAFMALCETMGYDRRGNELWLRTPEGDVIEKETPKRVIRRTTEGSISYEMKYELQRIRDDEVSLVSALFHKWRNPKIGGS